MNHHPMRLAVAAQPTQEGFRAEVLDGLRRPQRHLPCKYFYDERGCELFDQICELDDYYLTRTELTIMHGCAREMAEALGPQCAIIELGSGSSTKTRILLDHLVDPVAYMPVDIASEYLERSADELRTRYAGLEVLPVCVDFVARFDLPETQRPARRRAVYFPGSTIGNFEPDPAERLLKRIAVLAGPGGAALLGIDLEKDTSVLEAAYNDRQGVTAEFNLNLLRRINRELGADFHLERFRHEARYNSEKQRIEIYVVSTAEQTVTIDSERFHFRAGEEICTEYSHKYDLDQFAHVASRCGLRAQQVWTDQQHYFGVLYLET